MVKLSKNRCRRCRWSGLLLSVCALIATTPAGAAEPLDWADVGSSVNLALLQGPGMPGATQDLYLEVVLNQVHTHRVLHLAMSGDDHLYAWPENLEQIGLQLDGVAADRYLDLADLPGGLSYRYDVLNQRLYLDAAGAQLNLRTQTLNPRHDRLWPATVSPGLLLNYDLYGSSGDGADSVAATTELRAFGRHGVINTTGLSRLSDDAGNSREYIRLETAWSRSLQQQLLTLTAGDFVGGSLAWSRPTRMGGLQLRRNFSLQPQLVTYPLPQFFGEAALPSSVELYVNGLRQYRGEVLPGPFEINTVPNINGAGQALVVITDALGRSRSLAFDYYNAPQLLQRGLSDYSFELGSVRRDYGTESFSYVGGIVGSGSLRYGLSDTLTLETHAEGGDGLFAAGAGAVVSLGLLGSVNAAYALSTGSIDGDDAEGGQASLGYAWTGNGLSVNYQLTRTFDDYRDLAAREGRAPSLRSERAVFGYGMGRRGNLSLHYTRLDTLEDDRFRSVGASYSATLFDTVTVYLGGSRELDGAHDYGAFAGVSASFGRRLTAGASVSHDHGRNQYSAYLAQPLPADGGAGWSLNTQQGSDLESYRAEAGIRGDHAELRVGAWSINQSDSVYAAASGALILMERDLFAARRADAGFALVSTHGVADVPVMLENRPIGRTDSRGHYLLTGLNPYQPNAISIDALHLPAQIQVDSTRATAVPADRSGVTIDFALRQTRAALLILQDRDGQPVPLGSRIYRHDAGASTTPDIVGYDGQAYLEALDPVNTLKIIRSDGGSCTLKLAYPQSAQGIPQIGPLICDHKDGQ
jgi:outer membrane usher protein